MKFIYEKVLFIFLLQNPLLGRKEENGENYYSENSRGR